jgi:hypothetical protein
MTHEEILEALSIPGDTGTTNCPAHEDDRASLSVTLTDDDTILVRCHAGCEQQEVLDALYFTYNIKTSELSNGERREVARYVYRDGGGNPVFTKVRFKPKEFVIEPAGADTKSNLYRLPEILAAPAVKTVLWVEGEKAVDRLTELGFVATTMGGASKAPDKAVKVLKGRRVVILPDNDEPGKKHALTVSRCLKAAGVQTVRVLNLPDLPPKGDVVDWLDMGFSPETLGEHVRRSLGSYSAADIKIADPKWAWKPRVPATGLTLVFGEAGIGKSTMILDFVARWTRGDPMPESVGTVFKPVNVGIYGCEDDVASVVIPRLMAAGANLDRVFLLELDRETPILPNQVGRIREICQENDVHVLILDNIENGMGTIDTADSRSLRMALNPLSDLGMPVIAIHHPKKGAVNVMAREAMTGSQAYTNVARSTMMVIPTDEEGLVAFALVKSNYVSVNDARTLYFKIGSREVDGLNESQPVVEWKGGDRTTAEIWQAKARARFITAQQEALVEAQKTKNEGGRPKVTGIEEAVLGFLKEGWVDGKDLWAKVRGELGGEVSRSTYHRRLDDMIDGGEVQEWEDGYRLPNTNTLSCISNIKDNTLRNTDTKIATTPLESEGLPSQNLGVGFENEKTSAFASRSYPSQNPNDWVLDQQKKHGYGQFKKEEE